MRIRVLVVLLAFSSLALAADPAADRAALLKIHIQEREGHLKGDAALIAVALAPTLKELHGGRVDSIDRSKAIQDFSEYFKRVKYSSWDDVTEPEITISPDGQLAWVISQIKYEVAPADHPEQKQSYFNSSIETFEKGPSGWQMTAIAASAGR
jgi:hypothetical protein